MNRRAWTRACEVTAAGALAGFAAAAYPAFGRDRCLTWGAWPGEVDRAMPGDDLLPDAPIVSTRAISIDAPPAAIWPWLVQMGPGRGGAYTYDWIENPFGLNMHSADEIVPAWQNLAVGDEQPLGKKLRMRIEVLDAERAMVMRSDDGAWVWAFGLYPDPDPDSGSHAGDRTRLVSRNRIRQPRRTFLTDAMSTFVMEPGSLIMERKMLLGIKERAERLHLSETVAHQVAPQDRASCRALSPTRLLETVARIVEP